MPRTKKSPARKSPAKRTSLSPSSRAREEEIFRKSLLGRLKVSQKLSPSAKSKLSTIVRKMTHSQLREALLMNSNQRAVMQRPVSPRKSPAKKRSPKKASPKKASPKKMSPARLSPISTGKRGSAGYMSVAQLKAELRKYKAQVTGSREQLLKRLEQARNGELPAARATPALKKKALKCKGKKDEPAACQTPSAKKALAALPKSPSKEQVVKAAKKAGIKTAGTKKQVKNRIMHPTVNDYTPEVVGKAVNKEVKKRGRPRKTA